MESGKAALSTYAEALLQSRSQKRHLLLGNGFSIGVHRAFGYPSLHEAALARDPSLRQLFATGDTNFETALEQCDDPRDEARLREGLIRAVAAVHPEYSLSLTEEQCLSCRDFLEPFVGRNRVPLGLLFTSNYDMLLHWVLSRQGKNPGTKQLSQLKCWDGFSGPGEFKSDGDAQAYYLHGAVHIYDRPQARLPERTYTQMLRYEWGRPLTKQVDAELRAGRTPIFIAEGSSQKKKARQRGEYLSKAKRKFKGVCNGGLDSALFTFGHSFGASDNHIAEEIGVGTLRDVFIGVYSDGDRARADELADVWAVTRRAAGGPPIRVHRFESSECAVWERARQIDVRFSA
ncbi:MAG: DUF4917 family protein [Phenylobacterium sp.]|uniref:DUF4917 family protein n=1 Tax=Phenylobacterium sp. TaxID=1871053 RepID=UPI0027359C7B|nr:DUF4917 family protein [Phenylobacterium sp.]MDP3746902.1 DUF4917 family protein [Phenylobacterium sp.]